MKYPIGIQNFEDLRRNGYKYVDKTNFVYKLADEGKYYFLSRPRRFGKSLFLSTLEAYFQGKKELFEGLAIYDLETEWKKYPIFHIDLNTANFREKDSLYNVLNDYLTGWEDKFGARDSEVTLPLRFKGVIARAAEKELLENFKEGICQLAEANGDTEEATIAKLKARYDGYHFEEHTEGIFNPFSVLNTLAKLRFKDYWFETGTPTFLVDLLKKHNYRLPDMTKGRVSDDVINSVDSLSTNPIPVIYQSGYLTIKGYDERFKKYLLGFPNKEVEEGFLNFLLPLYTSAGSESTLIVEQFVRDVESGGVEQFMCRMQAFFADTSYQVMGNAELYFQNAMYLVLKIMGFYIQVERPTSDGFIDAIIQTPNYIYIIACMLDRFADEAFQQIEDYHYAAPFAMDKRKLYKIGVKFSSKTRGVEEWKVM